ncbi:mutator family transposase [Streptomyces brevispora]|uniref:Mutator family transposase n=1 Tax=Streptomyces brevispora TaxID=887462 RepID=A0A561UUD6_9ACTN|nr:mutator family transposase [Streptomyces brevispora]
MTSNNVTEVETVEPSEAGPAKSVDDRLIDELVGRAQAEGLQLTGEGGLLQQLTKRLLESALERFAEFADAWGRKYPAIVRLWENAWEEFTPFLRFDTEIRRIVCTTNAIESVNARIRRAVKARGHFPNEQAALKCVYMAIMSLDPTGKGQARWTMRWKTALNAFDITFDGRLSAARQ